MTSSRLLMMLFVFVGSSACLNFETKLDDASAYFQCTSSNGRTRCRELTAHGQPMTPQGNDCSPAVLSLPKGLGSVVTPGQVQLLMKDGSTMEGKVVSSDSDDSLRLQDDRGTITVVKWSAIAQITRGTFKKNPFE